MNVSQLITRIDALLPQTQCGKCGHPGCLPYAEAMAAGEAINKCPPGGQATVESLAELLGLPALPLAEPAIPAQLAVIREAECIGCTKCIQVCPTDAILGAAKHMHTVLQAECSGCELCLPACPVDCIDLLPLHGPEAEGQRARAEHFRQRHQRRQARLREGGQSPRPAASQRRPTADVPAAPSPATDQPAALKEMKLEAARLNMALARVQRQLQRHPQNAALLAQQQLLQEAHGQQENRLKQARQIHEREQAGLTTAQ